VHLHLVLEQGVGVEVHCCEAAAQLEAHDPVQARPHRDGESKLRGARLPGGESTSSRSSAAVGRLRIVAEVEAMECTERDPSTDRAAAASGSAWAS
jgi:hypothetical protein